MKKAKPFLLCREQEVDTEDPSYYQKQFIYSILNRWVLDYVSYLLNKHHRMSLGTDMSKYFFLDAKKWRYQDPKEEFSIRWYCELIHLDYKLFYKFIIHIDKNIHNKEVLTNILKTITRHDH